MAGQTDQTPLPRQELAVSFYGKYSSKICRGKGPDVGVLEKVKDITKNHDAHSLAFTHPLNGVHYKYIHHKEWKCLGCDGYFRRDDLVIKHCKEECFEELGLRDKFRREILLINEGREFDFKTMEELVEEMVLCYADDHNVQHCIGCGFCGQGFHTEYERNQHFSQYSPCSSQGYSKKSFADFLATGKFDEIDEDKSGSSVSKRMKNLGLERIRTFLNMARYVTYFVLFLPNQELLHPFDYLRANKNNRNCKIPYYVGKLTTYFFVEHFQLESHHAHREVSAIRSKVEEGFKAFQFKLEWHQRLRDAEKMECYFLYMGKTIENCIPEDLMTRLSWIPINKHPETSRTQDTLDDAALYDATALAKRNHSLICLNDGEHREHNLKEKRVFYANWHVPKHEFVPLFVANDRSEGTLATMADSTPSTSQETSRRTTSTYGLSENELLRSAGLRKAPASHYSSWVAFSDMNKRITKSLCKPITSCGVCYTLKMLKTGKMSHDLKVYSEWGIIEHYNQYHEE